MHIWFCGFSQFHSFGRVKRRETLHLEQLQAQVLHETGALNDRERGGIRFVELVGMEPRDSHQNYQNLVRDNQGFGPNHLPKD